jgi:glycosyltransferase involved in cell wall biosynthesis
LRIAIDASTISTQGGPRTYVLGLVEALLQIDRDNEYLVFYNDESHLGRFPGAKEIVLPGKNPLARLWREHVLLPRACRRERIDLLHCPKSAIPYFAPCPTVVTLHDLIPIKHPETEKFAARVYWRLQIPIAARRSSFIITDSEHARREIIEDFGVAPEKIKAIMLGFDPSMVKPRDPADGAAVRAKYSLPEGYILYVGTIQPRKNIDTLIEAYNVLKSERGVDCKLVIVGRKGWLYDQLFARIKELGLGSDVIFTGFVPDEDLPYIYDGARVFSYLSLFEGFGLPPLEAMACGIPVVTSNTTSLPEVVGEAGIAVPPKAVGLVAEALYSVLSSEETAAAMRVKGAARARSFSWEAAARETLAVYRAASRNR